MKKKYFYPPNGFVFDAYTEIQRIFIDKIKTDGTECAISWLKTVKNERECSKPQKLLFQWECFADSYLFEISEDDAFSSVTCFNTSKNFCELDNFKVGQKYFWRVNSGEVHWFETKSNLFRFINIDGALNVRDLGGNCIKQGFLYRGTEFDDYYHLNEEGYQAFVERLKIKTELDLRGENKRNLESSPFKGEVHIIQIHYRPYMEVFEEQYKCAICKIMDVLSDEKNYPMYMHCVGGADRTGMIALYLRALAGEADEEILTDYELTGLSTYTMGINEGVDKGERCRNYSYFANFLSALYSYVGGEEDAPLSTVIRLFLLDCGVKQQQIDRIIKIIKK